MILDLEPQQFEHVSHLIYPDLGPNKELQETFDKPLKLLSLNIKKLEKLNTVTGYAGGNVREG